MPILPTILIFFGVFTINHGSVIKRDGDNFRINITMNAFQTNQMDQYAFIRYDIPDEELYIVGYQPLVEMHSAHHMLTYACESPASSSPFWTGAGTCGGGHQMIIHGWAQNAPGLSLPENVGFAVGRNTPFKYIVVNIHYLSIIKDDYSGNQLIFSRIPRKYNAGVMLGGSNSITIKPKAHNVQTTFSCHYDGPPLSIFAVRVHAHQWGRVNSLFRVRDGHFTQIAKGDPKWPQSFYPIPRIDINKGDFLVGKCVYDNDEDRTIYVGSTHNDEMCNVYAMYSYEPYNSDHQKVFAPLGGCWENQNSALANLIPVDAENPPKSPTEMSGRSDETHKHTEHGMGFTNERNYEYISNWPDLKSFPTPLGEIGGIALNKDDSELVVFHRASRKWEFKYFDGVRFRNEKYGPIEEDVVIHIDSQTGIIKSRWGAKMFYLPHGLTIDNDGNYWLTDIGMHQVFMFRPTNLTHPALTLGKAFQSGSGANHFCRPADVAVMKNGDFFVADGYCNNRIVKFNRKGEYISEWGTPTSFTVTDENGFNVQNQWNIVHSIALSETAKLVCAADRENNRIQCFDLMTGEFQRQISVEKRRTFDSFFAIEFARDGNGANDILFAVTGGTSPTKKVYLIDAKKGEILNSFESNPSLIAPHDITVSSKSSEIYVGELSAASSSLLHKFQSCGDDDTSTNTLDKAEIVRDENFRTSVWIMIAFAFPVLIVITVGCFVRIRNFNNEQNIDQPTRNEHISKFSQLFALNRVFKRKQGFSRLNQESDDEYDQLEANAVHHSENSDNDKPTIVSSK